MTNTLDTAWLRPSTEPYRLGPGDVIEIELLGEAAGRSTVTLGPDGKIYYSLLPGLSVWGMTLAETRELVKTEMGKYNKVLPDPAVMLRGIGSKRVWFLGSSSSAGVYTLAAPTTLLEAVTTLGGVPASGPDDNIDLARSFVMRGGKHLPVNFERLFKQGDMSQNVYLEPDDFVFVRPANVANIYVMGAVNGPAMQPYSKDKTLATVLIAAGGLQKYAQPARVAIVRGGLTDPRIAEINYKDIVVGRIADIPLEPGDIVYVPFSPFRHVAQLAEEVIDQFVRTTAVNAGTRAISPNSAPVQPGVSLGGSLGPPVQ